MCVQEKIHGRQNGGNESTDTKYVAGQCYRVAVILSLPFRENAVALLACRLSHRH